MANDYHILKLGYEDNPTAAGTYLDLSSKGQGVWLLQEFIVGDVKTNEKGVEMLELHLNFNVQGSATNPPTAQINTFEQYLLRSQEFFEEQDWNIGARMDGFWHKGSAAVLTFMPAGATDYVYFDIVGGEIQTPTDVLDIAFNTYLIQNVKVTLYCFGGGARGDRAALQNVFTGSNDVTTGRTTLQGASWSATGGAWNFATDDTAYDVFNTIAAPLGALASGSATLTHIWDAPKPVRDGAKVVLDISLWFNSMSQFAGKPNWNIKAYGVNVSNAESLLGQFATFAPATQTTGQWLRYSSPAYTIPAGYNKIRLKIENIQQSGTVTPGYCWANRIACWINPLGDVAPDEYLIEVSKPYNEFGFQVWNVQGSKKRPVLLEATIKNSATYGTQNRRVLLIGGKHYKSSDRPLFNVVTSRSLGATGGANGTMGNTPNGSISSSSPGTLANPPHSDMAIKVVRGTWGIKSGALTGYWYSSSETQYDLMMWEAGMGSFQTTWYLNYAEAGFTGNSRVYAPVFNYIDSSNYMYLLNFTDKVYAFKVDAGVHSQLTGSPFTVSTTNFNGYGIKLVATSTTTYAVYRQRNNTWVNDCNLTLTSPESTKYYGYGGIGVQYWKNGTPGAAGGEGCSEIDYGQFSASGENAKAPGPASRGTTAASTTWKLQAESANVDRKYRTWSVYCHYAANENAAITGIGFTVNSEEKIFTKSLPQTFTGQKSPQYSVWTNGGDYKIAYLGEYEYYQPSSPWEEFVAAATTSVPGKTDNITVYHANNAAAVFAIDKIILVPSNQICLCDLGAVTNDFTFIVSNEPITPQAGFATTANYRAGYPPVMLNQFNPNATFTGGNFYLTPDGNAGFDYYRILDLGDRNATNTDVLDYNEQAGLTSNEVVDIRVTYTPFYARGFR